MNSAEILVKFKGDTKDLDKSTDKATSVLKGFGKGLAGVAATAAGVAATAIAATTKAVVDLTKASVKSYAEFEQLEGGVETLFGTQGMSAQEYADSVGKSVDEIIEKWTDMDTAQADVMYNAQNAYKTAGLSANEYMSTVTSFSASLIQSLGGDTLKASAYADSAITDMADNANKMGTSMEMIQSAYQGFAKQKYTMLDNLKLGYGGTKTEMERLLEDASKISGIEYDISSFADITKAIHVIQTEMGITGTTAKEAQQTISGSFNMMKSSWSNFITELGKPNADIEARVQELVESAMTFADNVVPVALRIVEGIAKALPMIATKIAELLPQLIDSLLPPLVDAVIKLVKSLADNLPKIIITLAQGLVQAVKGLSAVLPQILDALLKAALYLIIAIAQALPDMIPAIIDAILGMIPVLIENIPLFIQAGIELLLGLITGIIQAIPELLKQTKSIIKAVINAFKDLPMALFNAGKDMIKGLWNGIKNVTGWITDKIKGFGKSVMKAIKGIFGIHSPSTEFAWVGKMNILGLEKGMEDMQPQLQRTINGMFDLQPNVSGSMSNTYSPEMNVVVNNNMELDPIGQVVNKIKTFSGGAKNDYNWGATQ